MADVEWISRQELEMGKCRHSIKEIGKTVRLIANQAPPRWSVGWSAADCHWLGCRPVETATESVRACTGTTFWAFVMSLSDILDILDDWTCCLLLKTLCLVSGLNCESSQFKSIVRAVRPILLESYRPALGAGLVTDWQVCLTNSKFSRQTTPAPTNF